MGECVNPTIVSPGPIPRKILLSVKFEDRMSDYDTIMNLLEKIRQKLIPFNISLPLSQRDRLEEFLNGGTTNTNSQESVLILDASPPGGIDNPQVPLILVRLPLATYNVSSSSSGGDIYKYRMDGNKLIDTLRHNLAQQDKIGQRETTTIKVMEIIQLINFIQDYHLRNGVNLIDLLSQTEKSTFLANITDWVDQLYDTLSDDDGGDSMSASSLNSSYMNKINIIHSNQEKFISLQNAIYLLWQKDKPKTTIHGLSHNRDGPDIAASSRYEEVGTVENKVKQLQIAINEHHQHKTRLLKSWIKDFAKNLLFEPSACCIRFVSNPITSHTDSNATLPEVTFNKDLFLLLNDYSLLDKFDLTNEIDSDVEDLIKSIYPYRGLATKLHRFINDSKNLAQKIKEPTLKPMLIDAAEKLTTNLSLSQSDSLIWLDYDGFLESDDQNSVKFKSSSRNVQPERARKVVDWIKYLDQSAEYFRQVSSFLEELNDQMATLIDSLKVDPIITKSATISEVWTTTHNSINTFIKKNVEENYEIPSLRQQCGLWKRNWRAKFDAAINGQINNIKSALFSTFSFTHLENGKLNRVSFDVDSSLETFTITMTPTEETIRSRFRSNMLGLLSDIFNLGNCIEVDENHDDGGPTKEAIIANLEQDLDCLFSELRMIKHELEGCTKFHVEAMKIIRPFKSIERKEEFGAHYISQLSELLNIDKTSENCMHDKVLAKIHTRWLEYRESQDEKKYLKSILIDTQNIKELLNWSFREMVQLVIDNLTYSINSDIKRLQDYLDVSVQILGKPSTFKDLFILDNFINNVMLDEKSEYAVYGFGKKLTSDQIIFLKDSLNKKILSLNRWKKGFQCLLEFIDLRNMIDEDSVNVIELNYNNFTETLNNSRKRLNTIRITFKDKLNSEFEDTLSKIGRFVRDFQKGEDVESSNLGELSDRCEVLHEELKVIKLEYEYFKMNIPEVLLNYESGYTVNAGDVDSTLQQFSNIRKEMESHSNQNSLIRTFEESLQYYLNSKWLPSGRNILNEVMQCIVEYKNQHITSHEAEGSTHRLLKPLERVINCWISHIELLQNCRGNNFKDTHWIKFLDIIDMNKRINHRTMCMGDLIKSIDKIKTNLIDINKLNSQANLENDMNDSIRDLDKLIDDTHVIVIYSNIDFKDGPKFKIIKEFKTIFDQLRHCGSILRTLKLAANTDTIDNESFLSEDITSAVKEELDRWTMTLQDLENHLISLSRIQSRLLRLLPIFKKHSFEIKMSRPKTSKSRRVNNNIQDTIEESGMKYNQAALIFNTLLGSMIGYKNQRLPLNKAEEDFVSFKITKLLEVNNLKMQLQSLEVQLDQSQRELHILMEHVRDDFPRFYFLSDEELVYILAQDKNFVVNQTNKKTRQLIRKIFNNSIDEFVIKNIAGNDNEHMVVGVKSPHNEVIEFCHNIVINKTGTNQQETSVQKFEVGFLLDCIKEQISLSLKRLLLKGIELYGLGDPSNMTNILFWALPAQIMYLSCWLTFSIKVESSITSASLQPLMQDYHNILARLLSLKRSDIDTDSNEVVQFDYKKQSLILDIVHFISIIKILIENQVKDVGDWEWQKQLRYYLTDKESENTLTVLVKMLDASFKYNFELLNLNSRQSSIIGDETRIQCTKLLENNITHRCFLVSTQAVSQFKMGTNPYGPAGSGKTETIKALGASLGRHVMVYNCDETIDVHSLSRIIIGMAKSGYWCCLDEFNRLQLDVMSSLSSTLEDIQTCIKNGDSQLKLRLTFKLHNGERDTGIESTSLGSMINRTNSYIVGSTKKTPIDLDSAFFITLNPISERYMGRNKLPSNLKALFLPISMMQTSPAPIVLKLLMSKGVDIDLAEKISVKLITWFDKVQNALSQQVHYDWSLRTLMTIVRQLASFNCNNGVDKHFSAIEKQLVDVIILTIKPKLIGADLPKFIHSLEEIFGEIAGEKSGMGGASSVKSDRIRFIKRAIMELELVENDDQIEKVEQFYQRMQSHMGILVYGPASTGKSTTWKILQRAMNIAAIGSFKDEEYHESSRSVIHSNQSVEVMVINPKSVTLKELFGFIDPTTQAWNEGLFTKIARDAISRIHEATLYTKEAKKDNIVWIVMDGSIDPEWIESLNSILDDNQVFTLASGERIDFSFSDEISGENQIIVGGFEFLPCVKLIFETIDLRHASPASISRLGIVYHEIDISKLVVSKMTERISFGETNTLSSEIGPILGQVEKIYKENSMGIESLNDSSNIQSLSMFNSMKMVACNHIIIDRLHEGGRDIIKDNLTIVNEQSTLLECLKFWKNQINSCKVLLTEHEHHHSHILLTGKLVQIGKELIIEQLLEKNGLDQIRLVKMDCSWRTSSKSLMNQLISISKSEMVNQSHKRHIIWVNNIDLIDYDDKWNSKSFFELLYYIMTYGGYYNIENSAQAYNSNQHNISNNLSWFSIPNLQIICTAESFDKLTPRLLSKFNLIYLQNPTFDDIDLVSLMQALDVYNEINFRPNLFSFTKELLKKVGTSLSNCPRLKFLDHLLSDLSRLSMDMTVTEEDITGIISNIIGEDLNSAGAFMSSQSKLNYTTRSIQHDSLSIISISRQKFIDFCKECTETWLKHDESVVQIQDIIWTDQLVRLYSVVYSFLANMQSESILSNRNDCCRVLTLATRCHGIGRHLAIKTMAFKLGYSDIWSAEDCVNSTQLLRRINDISRNVYESLNDAISSTMISKETSAPAVLIVISHLEMSLNPDLFGAIYRMISLVQLSTYKLMNIKVIYVAKTLNNKDLSLWSTVGRVIYTHQLLSKSDLDSIVNHTVERMVSNIELAYKKSEKAVDKEAFHLNEIGFTFKRFSRTDWLESAFPLYYIDLRRFLSFCQDFSHIYLTNHIRLKKRHDRLRGGMEKLKKIQASISLIENNANEKEKSIESKEKEANELVNAITISVKNAEIEQDQLNTAKEEHEERSAEMLNRTKQLDQQLELIKPKIDEARANIKQYLLADVLSEIRALRAPPTTIRDILEATLKLMNIHDTSWTSMKQFLARKSLKDELTSFNAENLSPATIRQVELLIQSRRESFEEYQARRASQAVLPLLQWVLVTLDYGKVVTRLKPMRDELNQLQSSLKRSQQQKLHLGNQIDSVKSNVESLKNELDRLVRETTQLKLDLKLSRQILNDAHQILSRLEQQSSRWENQLDRLETHQQPELFEATCILIASLVNFCQDLGEWKLNELIEKFVTKMNISNMKLNMMEHLVEFLNYDFNCSISMRLFQSASSKSLTPLFTDSSLISPWLSGDKESFSEGQKIFVISACQSEWFREVALNLRFCDIIVIKDFFINIDSLDTQFLNMIPILRNELHIEKTDQIQSLNHELVSDMPDVRTWYNIGNHRVIVKRSVKIIFAANLSLSPSSTQLAELVNKYYLFKFVGSSHEDTEKSQEEVLNVLIGEIGPELAAQKVELERKLKTCREDLLKCDEEFLKLMIESNDTVFVDEKNSSSNSSFNINIIQNKDETIQNLLGSLKTVKDSADIIEKTVSELSVVSERLQNERENYKDVASQISKIIEVTTNLRKLNSLYRFSYDECYTVLRKFLSRYDGQKVETAQRIAKDFVLCIYEYVGCSLREKDRLAYLQALNYQLSVSTIDKSMAPAIDAIDYATPQNLTYVVKSLLGSDDDYWDSPYRSLVIVHDSKSTPIFEIEEALSQFKNVKYKRIFASSAAINMINDSLAIKESIDRSNSDITCLCLVNVHMIMEWTKYFYEYIFDIRTKSSKGKKLIILICETTNGMDLRLLDVARKFYFDERSLDILTRFNSLAQIMNVDSHQVKDSLVGQLILFHIVCQERTKYLPFGWTKDYDFDYDQFRQSLVIFKRLYTKADSRDKVEFLRKKFCHFLYSITYGARLDSSQDDNILISLINRFLSRKIGPQQLDQLKRLEDSRTDFDNQLLKIIDITKEISENLNSQVLSDVREIIATILEPSK